jgi:hypothetical protein
MTIPLVYGAGALCSWAVSATLLKRYRAHHLSAGTYASVLFFDEVKVFCQTARGALPRCGSINQYVHTYGQAYCRWTCPKSIWMLGTTETAP